MFCCTLLYVHSNIAIILMGKRELVALLNVSSWCLVVVGWLFLALPWGCLRFVIVVFPDHTHLLFFLSPELSNRSQLSAKEQPEASDRSLSSVKGHGTLTPGNYFLYLEPFLIPAGWTCTFACLIS